MANHPIPEIRKLGRAETDAIAPARRRRPRPLRFVKPRDMSRCWRTRTRIPGVPVASLAVPTRFGARAVWPNHSESAARWKRARGQRHGAPLLAARAREP